MKHVDFWCYLNIFPNRYILLYAPGPPMALASICIHFHDCSIAVFPSLLQPPITCLSTWLCISLQTVFTIFASFSKPQPWLRGAVVEIVQVCSFTFFRGLSFHVSTFSALLSDGRALIGITSVLLGPENFSLCL